MRRSPQLESGRRPRCCATRVIEVSQQLAQAIVRDGEGATKFITVQVEGGRDDDECRQVAYAIAHSPLVKTAFFASDPNLGRILAAVGYAGIDDLDQSLIDLFLDDVHVAMHGGRHPAYREEARPARDEAERDHGARRPAPRRGAAPRCGPATCRTTTSASTPTTAVRGCRPPCAASSCAASISHPSPAMSPA